MSISKTTFFLLLTAICCGNVAASSFKTATSTTSVQNTGAITSIPLSPADKGEPDSTMSGTSRSGLYVNSPFTLS